MIDFACRKFDLGEIIKCGLGLTKSEYRLVEFIIGTHDSFTARELSEALSLDLTTVQKAVKKLSEQKIILRGQKNLSGGGYEYTYRSNTRTEIRSILKTIIRTWSKKVETAIDAW